MSSAVSLGVVGLGNMGTAIVSGIVEAGWSRSKLVVYDIDSEKLEKFADTHDLLTAASIADLCKAVDVLLLAVKPADLTDVCGEITVDSITGIISIAAGVSTDKINSMVDQQTIVLRAMPNTPARVGKGLTFLAAEPDSGSDSLTGLAVKIFDAVGEVEIIAESQLDAVTALAGSGPAYIFYFLESLKQAGVYLGLKPQIANKTALETMAGAVELARAGDESFAQLREQVSSPGGTTVEALKYLDLVGFKGSIVEAVNRAHQKSRLLEKE